MTVNVPIGSLSAYQAADGWKDFWSLQEILGIESVVADSVMEESVKAIYDLQGRRLKAPRKGINIIDGKKVVVK